MADSFLTKWERVIKDAPLDGYAMAPEPHHATNAASIICGHDFIQRLTEDEQVEFELFVKDVLRSAAR